MIPPLSVSGFTVNGGNLTRTHTFVFAITSCSSDLYVLFSSIGIWNNG
jgi:hypothetical protein